MVLMKSLEQVNFNLEFTNQSHDLSNHVCKSYQGITYISMECLL